MWKSENSKSRQTTSLNSNVCWRPQKTINLILFHNMFVIWLKVKRKSLVRFLSWPFCCHKFFVSESNRDHYCVCFAVDIWLDRCVGGYILHYLYKKRTKKKKKIILKISNRQFDIVKLINIIWIRWIRSTELINWMICVIDC